jgi:hypothetical protein
MNFATITDSTILNATGIIFEIAGFVVLLIAIKAMRKPSKEKGEKVGSNTSDTDYLPNVMSTRHPTDNKVGIGLVVVALVFQLTTVFFV